MQEVVHDVGRDAAVRLEELRADVEERDVVAIVQAGDEPVHVVDFGARGVGLLPAREDGEQENLRRRRPLVNRRADGLDASAALVLGLVGIYGVIAYTVSQRTREIGIRLALGAQQGDVKRMFVRSGLALVAAGIVVGLTAAALLTQAMASVLFGVDPLDPPTFAAVPLVLLAAALVASYVPARRAAAIAPVEALKAE